MIKEKIIMEDNAPLPSFDSKGVFNFLFLNWISYWIKKLDSGDVDPEELPRLPIADRISYWQPIFSKHVGDSLLRLEEFTHQSQDRSLSGNRIKKTHKSIYLKCLWLTVRKRVLILIIFTVISSLCSFISTLMLNELMSSLSSNEKSYTRIALCATTIPILEVFFSIMDDHLMYYSQRLKAIVEYLLSMTVFEHGLCYRRSYAAPYEDIGAPKWCKNIVHSRSKNSSCTISPFECPASRHQNYELSESVYVYFIKDSYCGSFIFDSIASFFKVAVKIFGGMSIIYYKMTVNITYPLIIVLSIILVMIIIEIIRGEILKHSLASSDYRVKKVSEIMQDFDLLKNVAMEDLGYNKITNSRNDELYLLACRFFCFFTAFALNHITGSIAILIILLDYIGKLKDDGSSTEFNIAAPITLLHVISLLVTSTRMLPEAISRYISARKSIDRLDMFIQKCSPNYYLKSHGNGTRGAQYGNDANKKTLEDDMLVEFNNASFGWINSREELLKSNTDNALFRNINFVLKQGEIAFVTGRQGCGKSSFIKSVLGEMTLLDGSMAVAPLSTGMPIFYASQNVWIPKGSIKSTIIFDHGYDENIYKKIVRCVELESDFSSWAEGDERVVSDRGYSLSGGQRIRLGLARAMYAYMIYSRDNDNMKSDPCCFLMCLDDVFTGLDPIVAKSIFNNLFNPTDGLLLKGDVSVICTINNVGVEDYVTQEFLSSNPDFKYYKIGDRNIVSSNTIIVDSPRSIQKMRRPLKSMSRCFMFNGNRSLSISTNNDFDTQSYTARCPLAHGGYSTINQCSLDTNEIQKNDCNTSKGYITYFYAFGKVILGFVILLLLAATILESANKVLITDWSNSVMEHLKNGSNDAMDSQINNDHVSTTTKLIIMTVMIILLVFSGTYLGIYGNIKACKVLHEYAVKSIFFKSSSELKIRKSLNNTLGVFTGDFTLIDDTWGKLFILLIFLVLDIIVRIPTMCYSLPIISPFPFLAVFILFVFASRIIFLPQKKIFKRYLGTISKFNGVYSNAVTGAHIFRRYKKEVEFMKSIHEASNIFYGLMVNGYALNIWTSIRVRLLFALLNCTVVCVPIVLDLFFNWDVPVGHFGLALSLSMNFNGSIHLCLKTSMALEKVACAMLRFNEFFLYDSSCSLQENFENMNEIALYDDQFGSEKENRKKTELLIKRRIVDYRMGLSRRYRCFLSNWFIRPKIDIVKLSDYLPFDHVKIELKDVYVPQPNSSSSDVCYILRNINCSANASEIIGVIGRTGSGKSTLLYTLQNISRRRKGSVLLDGRDLNDIPRRIIRLIVGVLPQIPFVFKGCTIRGFLDPRRFYSDSEINAALSICGLLEFVEMLPGGKGLNTVIEPDNFPTPEKKKYRRGIDDWNMQVFNKRKYEESKSTSLFSNAQLRSLSLVRLMLYRNQFRLLLVDEPPFENSVSMDNKDMNCNGNSYMELSLPLYDLIKKYFHHCTVFIVAHDTNSIKSCTSIWIMSSGEVIKQLDSKDLLQNSDGISVHSILTKYGNAAQ
ncbi:bifunctional ABC transporter type 1 [Babesia duncani]|uniref:Bifunctional ABC transporter type 1 n=1 Tax=Babesia duncani TaxID=323732 RepID=A0AAD9UM87_9APIC|nr:bifunctional ABC transporter type 1 [Babesia duncani]KAK2196644.1 bifunctional ABC transporter type 1 [Babesia duncani]